MDGANEVGEVKVSRLQMEEEREQEREEREDKHKVGGDESRLSSFISEPKESDTAEGFVLSSTSTYKLFVDLKCIWF